MTDWKARAEREAAALLAGCGAHTEYVAAYHRDTLIELLAMAWLQGVILGSHETLAAVEVGFAQMQARL